MADRFVSVRMNLSDLERPDARNQFFFQADLNNAGLVSHVIAFAQMRRAVCQRQPSFLSTLRMASPDTIILLIVDYHASIGSQDPRAPAGVRLCAFVIYSRPMT